MTINDDIFIGELVSLMRRGIIQPHSPTLEADLRSVLRSNSVEVAMPVVWHTDPPQGYSLPPRLVKFGDKPPMSVAEQTIIRHEPPITHSA